MGYLGVLAAVSFTFALGLEGLRPKSLGPWVVWHIVPGRDRPIGLARVRVPGHAGAFARARCLPMQDPAACSRIQMHAYAGSKCLPMPDYAGSKNIQDIPGNNSRHMLPQIF